MAKRGKDSPRAARRPAETGSSRGPAVDPMERRVVAFAEQLGRIVGTVQGRAAGWMDPKVLNKQLAGVRDGATDLLDRLAATRSTAAGKSKAARKNSKAPQQKAQPSPAPGARQGRSRRGLVDAPGKTHRRPPPPDPKARLLSTQTSKLRTANTRAKARRLGPGG